MGLIIGMGNAKSKPANDNNYNSYGIEWDYNIADSACKRLGRPELHASLPIQSKMRRCILRDNGTVAYYLHANDSTKRENGDAANLDGSDGQVMVEIPAHYRKFETEGTKSRCYLSEFKLPGFHLVPLAYRSAYEAAIDRTTESAPKLASVVNSTTAFRGGQNIADWDGTYRSLLGKPGTYTTLTDFRAYARRRGNAGLNGAGWNCDVYEVQKTCYWLYAVEYANFNCQLEYYDVQPVCEGYKQGGLGQGVTTLPILPPDEIYYCMVPCGVTNILGNNTGVVDYTCKNIYNTNDDKTVQVPNYRGLENLFGDIGSLTDGCKCHVKSYEDTDVPEFYVCLDPSKYQDSDCNDYELRGILSKEVGYVKIMMLGEYGENMPAAVGGSSSTFFADFYTPDVMNSIELLDDVIFGGISSSGRNSGLGSIFILSFKHTDVGSRLCFLP